jgi:ribosome-associated protein
MRFVKLGSAPDEPQGQVECRYPGSWTAGQRLPIIVRDPTLPGNDLMAERAHQKTSAPLPSATAAAEAADPTTKPGTHASQDNVPTSAVARRSPERVEIALEHARIGARIADENRGKDILLLDLRGVTPLVDFFVIASATSRRQGHAIASEIDAEMKKLGERKLGIEGSEEGRWILIDYGDFVVHVFSDEARAYYALEEIWGDAEQLDWQDPARVRPPSHAPSEDPAKRP